MKLHETIVADDEARTNEVPCSICGAEHDPATTLDLDSTHLCPACIVARGATHQPRYRTASSTLAPPRTRAA